MTDPATHPDGCGCAVCRRRREAVASDPWAAEVAATQRPDADRSAADDERPTAAARGSEPVVEEHHETVVVHEHQHTTEQHQHGGGGGRERGRSDRRFARRHHTHRRHRGGILRTLLVGLLAVWVVHSFYPNLNVPLVPGIACTSSSSGAAAATQPAGVYVPGPNITPPPGTPGGVPNPVPKVGDLLADTAGHAAKTVALLAAEAVLHTVGATVRELATAPPSLGNIRAGLVSDFHTAGRVAGFVVGGLAGRQVGPAPNVAQGQQGDGSGVAAAAVCGACPGAVVPAATGALDGAQTAARAALRAGWTGAEAVTAVAVAGAESGWRHDAHNHLADAAGNSAYGMWQTMLPMHAHLFAGSSWSDPYANARVAHQLWVQGGWGPWVSSRANWGAHMAAARAAVAAVTAGSSGPPRVAAAAYTTSSSDHLQPVTRAAEAFIRSRMGFGGTIYGYSHRFIAGTHTLSEHAKGLALDMMTTSRGVGDPIAAYFSGPGAASWGVHNVIWQDRIWTSEGQVWKSYGDHGNPTLNHMDHVHVDFHDGAPPAGGAVVATRTC